jgi:hypothetical protein
MTPTPLSSRTGRTRLRATIGVLLLAAAGCGGAPTPEREWHLVMLDAAGQPMHARGNGSHTHHHCVRDEATGLTWSVERDEPGLLHQAHTYSWYSSDPLFHMSEPGGRNGGECPLDHCDTEALIDALNELALCGREDWRLPTREEALTLVDPSRIGRGATLNPVYFPAAIPDEYWTATTFPMYPQGAWVFDARHGHDRVDWKVNAKRVRAVAGRPRR